MYLKLKTIEFYKIDFKIDQMNEESTNEIVLRWGFLINGLFFRNADDDITEKTYDKIYIPKSNWRLMRGDTEDAKSLYWPYHMKIFLAKESNDGFDVEVCDDEDSSKVLFYVKSSFLNN